MRIYTGRVLLFSPGCFLKGKIALIYPLTNTHSGINGQEVTVNMTLLCEISAAFYFKSFEGLIANCDPELLSNHMLLEENLGFSRVTDLM